jgi:hypothetical protein
MRVPLKSFLGCSQLSNVWIQLATFEICNVELDAWLLNWHWELSTVSFYVYLKFLRTGPAIPYRRGRGRITRLRFGSTISVWAELIKSTVIDASFRKREGLNSQRPVSFPRSTTLRAAQLLFPNRVQIHFLNELVIVLLSMCQSHLSPWATESKGPELNSTRHLGVGRGPGRAGVVQQPSVPSRAGRSTKS